MRRDTDQYGDGAKRMRNARAIDSGSFERRPGTEWIATFDEDGILVPFNFSPDQTYELHFYDGAMDAYLEDGTAAGGVTSAPWTTAMLPELRWHREGDVLFVFHRDMSSKMVRRTGAATWALEDYDFSSGIGNSIDQPYFKLAANDTTLQPSALTGSVTLTTSSDFFVSGHIGSRVRYLDREIEITAVTNGTTATGTVRQTLPPTQTITVASSAVFQVGQAVEGSSDSRKGRITAIPSGTTVTVVVTTGTSSFAASGNLIGPDGLSAISGVSNTTPAAIKDWDEQMCNDVNGYFGSITIHRNRLVLSDHKSLPDALCLSRTGDFFNFSLGTGAATDSIFEFIGDGSVSRVGDMVSAETLLIYTNAGTFYVPERTDPPFTPTAFSIRQIDSVQCGPVRAVKFERYIFIPDASGKRLYQTFPTGDDAGPWASKNVSLLSPHLIRNPVAAAQAEIFLDYAERYSFVVNSDGTLAVVHAIEDQQVLGISLWETEGEIKSICASGNNIFILVQRTIDGSTVYTLEKFNAALRLDCARTLDDLNDTDTDYADQDVYVTGGDFSYGEVTVASDGSIELDTNFEGPFEIGFFYSPDVELPTPEISGDGIATIAAAVKRITKAYIHTVDSGRYFVNGVPNSNYKTNDDLTASPPLRTEIRRVSLLGKSREPTVRITQEDAAPLKVIGVTMEVAY